MRGAIMETDEFEDQLTLGREDEGPLLSSEEFAKAFYLEPWTCERVEGKLLVLPPNDEDQVDTISPWLRRLIMYEVEHQGVVRAVVPNAWVRVDDKTDRIGNIGIYLAHDPPALEIPDQAPDLMFEIVCPGRESR